jgi:hypothetical protein
VLLCWCDETAGSITAKYLAYDIANGPLPLAGAVQFAIAVVSMVCTTKRCVFSMVCGRGDWSGVFVNAGRPHAHERSLLVQTEPSGRL